MRKGRVTNAGYAKGRKNETKEERTKPKKKKRVFCGMWLPLRLGFAHLNTHTHIHCIRNINTLHIMRMDNPLSSPLVLCAK